MMMEEPTRTIVGAKKDGMIQKCPSSLPTSDPQTTFLSWSTFRDYHQTLYDWIEPSRRTLSSWLTGVVGRSWNSALQYVFKDSTATTNGPGKSTDDYVDDVCAYCGDAICVKRSEKESGRIVVCDVHCLQNWVAHTGLLRTTQVDHHDAVCPSGDAGNDVSQLDQPSSSSLSTTQ